jgi:glycosyltransferase involved in cell wall biosynthesis
MSPPRVLVVSPRFPLPLQSGTQLRVYHCLRALAERFDVTLVSLVQQGEGVDRVEEIEELGVEVETVPHGRSKPSSLARFALSRAPYRVAKFDTDPLREVVRETLAESDFALVWVHFLTTLASLPTVSSTPLVLDQHNETIEYWDSFRRGNAGERLFARINQARLRRLRERVLPAIDTVLSVSGGDAEATREWAECPVYVVPNGIDTGQFTASKPASEVEKRVAFVGSLNVRMNEEALAWFVEESWPRVRDRHPETTFSIVGRSPSSRVRKLDDQPGVEVVGPVPEVEPCYERSAVMVAPFAFGGGTKLKILEALSMERGLVTTPTGAVGIDIKDGRHALVRDRNESFANGVADLLEDPAERSRMGANGRELVRERYDWDRVMSQALDRVTETLL